MCISIRFTCAAECVALPNTSSKPRALIVFLNSSPPILYQEFLTQSRKDAKKTFWKRGSALRLCAFA